MMSRHFLKLITELVIAHWFSMLCELKPTKTKHDLTRQTCTETHYSQISKKKKKDLKKTNKQNLNEAQQETLHQRRCRWLLNKNYVSQKTIDIQRVGRKSANLEFVSGKCAL